jgi:amylosucrase
MESQWHSLRRQCEQRWQERGLKASSLWPEFELRLDAEFQRLAELLWTLYGDRPDFAFQVETLVAGLFASFEARPDALKARDRLKSPESGWFLGSDQVGAVAYVDRFAGTFCGLEARIPYLKELGVTYLHLMPFFLAPEKESDGGYAVSSYRDTNPALGTMADLEHMAALFEKNGIGLVADFVFNHTSDEHAWAAAAKRGQSTFQDYYWMFDEQSETLPWQANLRDIFPETRKGSFTWRPELRKWVWTTFNSFQWDLNYRNPAVFGAMAGEMVSLANRGISILRLDAVAFVWKQLGTNCENLPEAHTIIQAFQCAARLACPSLLFKSEAIVHPDDIARYIDLRECQLSYNPLLMAELWEAAATKDARLLAYSMNKRHNLPAGTAWVNYVRCHDDIGWTFADEDAAHLGINGYDHRQFLNRFYTGEFPGTFSRGVSFQYNPLTGDRRICGSAASLAGVERARAEHLKDELAVAVNRLLLLYTVAYTAGGIPLLYLGDEVAVENWYDYQQDPAMAADSRWVHRPLWNEELAKSRHQADSVPGRVFAGLAQLARLRRENPAFGVQAVTVIPTPFASVLAFAKELHGTRVTVVGNFAEHAVSLDVDTAARVVGGRNGRDLLTGEPFRVGQKLALEACGVKLILG